MSRRPYDKSDSRHRELPIDRFGSGTKHQMPSNESDSKKEKFHIRRPSVEKKDRPRRSFVDDHKQSDSDNCIEEPSGSDNLTTKSSKNKRKSPKALHPLVVVKEVDLLTMMAQRSRRNRYS